MMKVEKKVGMDRGHGVRQPSLHSTTRTSRISAAAREARGGGGGGGGGGKSAAKYAVAKSPEAGAKKSNGRFGGGVTGSSPFLVSGELFLRSTPQLFVASEDPCNNSIQQYQQQKNPRHPSAGLLAGLSGDLRDLLLCYPDLHHNPREDACSYNNSSTNSSHPCSAGGNSSSSNSNSNSNDSSIESYSGLVAQARRERRLARAKRIEQLKASKTIVGCKAAARLGAVRMAMQVFRRGRDEGRTRLVTRLRGLILRFAAAVSAEMAEEDAQTAAEVDYCARETERLDLAARLASLAATAEHRTRGSVVLRRLPPSHPQHARCLRAATENVKPGFFSSESRWDAVRVLDIYKIENRFLLERFQRSADATDQCKVKGLFCHVPDDGLEHVVMYGMGAGPPADNGSTDPRRQDGAAEWGGGPLDPIWAACGGARRGGGAGRKGGGGSDGDGERSAEGDVAGATVVGSPGSTSKPLRFPRSFSRHSTLEEEREYANNGPSGAVRDDDRDSRLAPSPSSVATFGGGGATSVGESSSRRSSQGAPGYVGGAGGVWPRRYGGDGQEGGVVGVGSGRGHGDVSGLRFLALCRVMIGSMYVSPSTGCTVDRGGGNDTTGVAKPRGDGGADGEGFASSDDKQPRRKKTAARAGGSDGATIPLVNAPPSLPRPPPGQAEFDSVYFPHEEEYRLLEEAFVLPEFLVVHRFVDANGHRPDNNRCGGDSRTSLSTPSSASLLFGQGADDAGNRYRHGGSIINSSGADDDGNVGMEGGRGAGEELQGGGGGKREVDGKVILGSGETLVSSSAASVVAGIEAAMNCSHRRRRSSSSSSSSSISISSSNNNNQASVGATKPVMRGTLKGGASSAAVASAFEVTGAGLRSCSAEANGCTVETKAGAARGGVGRGRERGSGRAKRDCIEAAVELTFSLYWQEVERLWGLAKKKVSTSAATSSKRLRQPP